VSCGLDAQSDVLEHWSPVLGGRPEKDQLTGLINWRAPCPGCGADRGLKYRPKGRYVEWCLFCVCEKDVIRAKLAELLPGCVAVRYRGRHRVETAELVELAEDRSLHELSLRVALYDMAGVGLRDACDRLGVSRAQRYRVVSQVRQRRRS